MANMIGMTLTQQVLVNVLLFIHRWCRRSVFYLPKPRPLDHMVGALFGGPTLVLNGALDPLQKAVERAEVRPSAVPLKAWRTLCCREHRRQRRTHLKPTPAPHARCVLCCIVAGAKSPTAKNNVSS